MVCKFGVSISLLGTRFFRLIRCRAWDLRGLGSRSFQDSGVPFGRRDKRTFHMFNY